MLPTTLQRRVPIFHMRKLRLREVNSVTQGHRVQTTIVTGGFSCLVAVILPSAGLWADPGSTSPGNLLKI